MKNHIKFTTVTISDEEFYEVGIEPRFADGQKYKIASIPQEHEDFSHWLSDEINAGMVLCLAKTEMIFGTKKIGEQHGIPYHFFCAFLFCQILAENYKLSVIYLNNNYATTRN